MNARVQDILKSLNPPHPYPPHDQAVLLLHKFTDVTCKAHIIRLATHEEREWLMTNGGDIIIADCDALFAYLVESVAAQLGDRRCSQCGAPLTIGYDEDGDVCAACYF